MYLARLFLLTNGNGERTTIIDTLSDLFRPILEFFEAYGEIGLFIYSIIETITPLAGVEFILFPLLLQSPERWWFITLNLVVANTIGAIIVYIFMASENNKIYNRLVRKKHLERAKKLFDRYGFWAIFIFALTPLPFFLIIFTAAVARMKFPQYVFAAFFSRAVRFYITSYAVVALGRQADIIFWLAIVGVSVALFMMWLQRRALAHFEEKENMPKEGEDTKEAPEEEVQENS